MKHRGALVWRLWAVGVVQLSLVVVATLAIGWVVQRTEPPWHAQAVARELQPLLGEPEALDALLKRLQQRDVRVALYDEAGDLLLANTKKPLPLPPFADRHRVPGPAKRPEPPMGPQVGARAGRVQLERGPTGRGAPPPPPPHGLSPPPPPSSRSSIHELYSAARALLREPGDEPPLPPFSFAPLELLAGGEGVLIVHGRPAPASILPALLALASGLAVILIGAFLTARWLGHPVQQLSRVARILGAGDLSARTGMDRADEFGDLARTIDDMAGRLQRQLAAEKELLANVAHELRTPLARISVGLELASEADFGTVRDALSEIARDLAELESLVADVLAAARLNTPLAQGREAWGTGFALHCRPVSAGDLVRSAADRFRALHPDRTLEATYEDDLPLIEADPSLLRRALNNLLENADKYTPDPTMAIGLRASVVVPVSVGAGDGSGRMVVFEVRDHGIGIVAEELEQVFAAFFRSERSRSRDTGGVGLGLTLAKRIVEAHGGALELASGPGVGTIARVKLPALVEGGGVAAP